jgi:dTDP-4-dehydrorhamnose reductase
MRIAITGSKGQLGRQLARVLEGNDLVLLDLPEVDVRNRVIIQQRIIDIKPEVVIHAAAMTDVDACELAPSLAYRVNALGTRYVADAAERAGARLLYISTDYVFDGAKRTPYVEADRPNPINVHGRSKLEGERFAQRCASRALILRTSWLYGGGSNNFVSVILRLARERDTLRVVNDQVGSPTWAAELADVIRGLLAREVSGIVHAAGLGACSRFELARAIVELTGLAAHVVPVTTEEYPRPARRPPYCALSQGRLNELGLSIGPWREGLREFLRQYGDARLRPS